jgi:hypothetical protein
VVVTHAKALLSYLDTAPVGERDADSVAVEIPLYKDFGETRIDGLGALSAPAWNWGKR